MSVSPQALAFAVVHAYARPPIGCRLIPAIVGGRVVCRAIKLQRADCWDKASRLDLIRDVHRRIVRLREIFRLLAELRALERGAA